MSAADSAREAAAALERCDALGLNATLHWSAELLDAQAAAVDRRAAAGEVLPLAGVPVAIKDNIVTADAPTTCAS
ncbi:MAG TPA: amidase family protein, partial [Gemmatimonadales bacterium]|nr:amidase family protein [Gemmatimonadales bacterium]